MSILDFLKQSIKSYNSQGYDERGYDRQGYDRSGYDEDGYDKQGFDRDGYDRSGFHRETHLDRDGRDANGFDKNGYDQDGFNSDGYDRDGYDRQGLSKDGFDRFGFDSDGYNQAGFDSEGYDHSGFNSKGFDKEGYDHDGFDSNGYDRQGYNRKGYDREGYKADGYNRYGYDRNGFNRDGYDKSGYDHQGFNKKGFDRDGFDKSGFDKTGHDRDGYDRQGFDASGFDRNGFDKNGYDKSGYNADGYDIAGFNAAGISVTGFPKSEYENGYHVKTQRDPFGYDRLGYNEIGINKITGKDRLGFDENGMNEDGFSIWGINPDTGLCIDGTNVQDADQNQLTEENCAKFQRLYYRFMSGDEGSTQELAYCYRSGKGTIQDGSRAADILLIAAIEYASNNALELLASKFEKAEEPAIAKFLKAMAGGQTHASFYKYKAGQAIAFSPVKKEKTEADKEQFHLDVVLDAIESEINSNKNAVVPQDTETWWMDKDQLGYWRENNFRNQDRYRRIRELKEIKDNPYYARFDLEDDTGSYTFYIGQEAFFDGNRQHQIHSVWSEVGKAYRAMRNTSVTIKQHTYDVELRRKIDISDGRVTGIFDEYATGSVASSAKITDPYLLRILEKKRGEESIANIISTIQNNQNDIIEEDPTANIIVQGCAGSGKTMILLHRLANLKYNNPHFDWKSVKIITPNAEFSLYIDELSQNLKIDNIERLTLGEYYYSIMMRYSNFASSIERPKDFIAANRRMFFGGNEQHSVEADSECGIELASFIYSDKFKKSFENRIISWKELQESVGFDDAIAQFGELFSEVLGRKMEETNIFSTNYLCILYAKVLYLYSIFGPLSRPERMLCVDEGQDICENQYLLLRDINNRSGNICLNIFGDLGQRIADNVSLSSWDDLSDMLSASYYELNENFRNSQEIVDYYNQTLNMNNKAFGIKVKPVAFVPKSDLITKIREQVLLKNKAVIIAKEKRSLSFQVQNLIETEPYSHYLSVMDIKQVKGLEFDSAFVVETGMDRNDRYIAYSRALSELYIVRDSMETSTSESTCQREVVLEDSTKKSTRTSATVLGPKSIAFLMEQSGDEALIIVRSSWKNDFCFRVSEIIRGKAYGTEYLNGRPYRKTNFAIDKEEWIIYTGPSKEKIMEDIR